MTRLQHEMRALLGETTGPAPGGPAEPEVMRVLNELDDSLRSSQTELAALHKKLSAQLARSKRADDLRAVLLIMKEAHGILGQLRTTVAEEFGAKHAA